MTKTSVLSKTVTSREFKKTKEEVTSKKRKQTASI